MAASATFVLKAGHAFGVFVLPWSLLIPGILAAFRQIFHLSTRPNLADHLSGARHQTRTPLQRGATGFRSTSRLFRKAAMIRE
jgi:hypothetical protein